MEIMCRSSRLNRDGRDKPQFCAGDSTEIIERVAANAIATYKYEVSPRAGDHYMTLSLWRGPAPRLVLR